MVCCLTVVQVINQDMSYRYGWRYQIGPWTSKGYRVIVPDMLGYGGTDKPLDTIEYTTKRLSDDLAALLDLISVEKAVGVAVRDLGDN